MSLTDNAAQTAALEQYLAPTPKPCYTVQNPYCCQSYGCKCQQNTTTTPTAG